MRNLGTVTAPDECKVFTPPPLAGAMAGVLPDGPACRWLEPCVGKGVFLDALADAGVNPQRITAVELDHHNLAEKCGDYYPGVEFLSWALATELRFDRVIGNPPFLKLHRAHPEVITAALRVPRPSGGTVPLRANCWYAFICAALRILRPGGGLCLILPAGWEYADYATDLRERLPCMFSRFEVIRGARSFFPGILDGCVVLIADGYGQPNRLERRFEFPTLSAVVQHLGAYGGSDANHVPAEKKGSWSGERSDKLTPFGAVARVRIGAVTGDAQYFLMTEARRVELGIDTEDVLPVLSRARHLEVPSVTSSTWRALRDRGERVWLFRPRLRSGRRPKAVEEYLEAGIKRGSHKGQKTRERDHWFITEINPRADGFMSGMTSTGPWLCLNRSASLTATNTLYTVHFHNPLALREKAAWALSLISSTCAAQYGDVGRCYSKGLLKFEPQDVMNLQVHPPVDSSERAIDVYSVVVNELLAGRVDDARELAEGFVLDGLFPESS